MIKLNKQLRLLTVAVCLAAALPIIHSCRKDRITSQPEDLLTRSKTYFNHQLEVEPSTDPSDLNIRLYKPDWSKVKYRTLVDGTKVLGVSLFSSDKEYIEFNVSQEKDGNVKGEIKRLLFTNGLLSFYSGSGRLKMEGGYNAETGEFKMKRDNGATLSTEMGGELETVIITPDDPNWPPFVLPPVIPPSYPPNPDPNPNPDPGPGGTEEPPLYESENPGQYELENDKDAMDLSDKFDCFNGIPNTGASYSAKICADLPNNSNPKALVWGTTPGHAFITLTKTNGSQSATVTFGFYPAVGYKSLANIDVKSQMNDDGAVNHEYNASLNMTGLSAASFTSMQSMAIYLAEHRDYDLDDYNCTDYALQVFNSGRPTSDQLYVPDWSPAPTMNYGTTPNGLYKKISELKTAGNTNASNTKGNAPTTTKCK